MSIPRRQRGRDSTAGTGSAAGGSYVEEAARVGRAEGARRRDDVARVHRAAAVVRRTAIQTSYRRGAAAAPDMAFRLASILEMVAVRWAAQDPPVREAFRRASYVITGEPAGGEHAGPEPAGGEPDDAGDEPATGGDR